MKLKLIAFSAIVVAALSFSFTLKNEIASCYISFKTATNLTAAEPDRLPEAAATSRKMATEKGEVEVSCVDGYRVLYNNEKKAPFVNLKVELSEKSAYNKDQQNLIDNLRYLNLNSSGMETKDLIELKMNGFTVYGLSRASMEKGSTLGMFILFPGNDVTVYFYFNNLKPDFRNFESIEDYKKLRDQFLDEYTKHLKSCKN